MLVLQDSLSKVLSTKLYRLVQDYHIDLIWYQYSMGVLYAAVLIHGSVTILTLPHVSMGAWCNVVNRKRCMKYLSTIEYQI